MKHEPQSRVGRRSSRRTIAAAVCVGVALPVGAKATTTYYIGATSGLWTTASNWSPAVVPAAGTDVVIGQNSNAAAVVFNTTYASSLNSLTINSTDVVYYLTLMQNTAGTTMMATSEYVGVSIPENVYNQSAGTNITSNLYFGNTSSGIGNYFLSGSGILSAGTEYLGNSGQGIFQQTGGTNTVSNTLYVGAMGAGSDSYTLAGGNLNITGGQIVVGSPGSSITHYGGTVNFLTSNAMLNLNTTNGLYTLSGTGAISGANFNEFIGGSTGADAFVQSGGSNIIGAAGSGSQLDVGSTTGAVSTYTLSSTTGIPLLAADYEDIGGISNLYASFTSGVFTQTGGTNTVNNQLNIGVAQSYQSTYTASSLYNMNGGTLNVNGNATIGQGIFNQSNGITTITGSLSITGGPEATGYAALSGPVATSVLNVYGPEEIGGFGYAQFNQTGGTHNITGDLQIAGIYLISGGILNETGNLTAGQNASGIFNQTGGTVTVGSAIYVGANLNSVGTLSLSNGNMSAGKLYVGYSGNGTASQNSGNLNVSGAAYVGYATGSNGIYSLNGGNLNVQGALFAGYSGTGTFNQNGGSLSAFSIYVGTNSTATGNFNLTAGNVSAAYFYINDNATVIQNGGNINLGSGVFIGNQGNLPATYYMYGGTLVGPNVIVGYTSSASMLQYGNNSNVSVGNLTLGQNAGTVGTYTLEAGNASFTNIDIGYAGTGYLNISGGTLAANYFYQSINGPAFVTLAYGSINISNTMVIGNQIAPAVFTMTNGTLTVPASSSNGYGALISPGAIFNQSGGVIYGLVENEGIYNFTGGGFNGTLINAEMGVANFNQGYAYIGTAIQNHGVMNISGGVGTPPGGTFFNDGTINVTSTGQIATNGTLTNEGTINAVGAVSGSGTFTNYLAFNQGAGTLTFGFGGGALNYGTFNLSNGHALSLQYTLTNYGALNVNGGLMESAATGATLANSQGGVVNGPGTILSAFSNSGTVLPGSSTLNISSSWNNNGIVQLTAASSGLTGGTINNTGTIVGLGTVGSAITNAGTIQGQGGILSLQGTVTNPAAGLITAGTGGEVLVTSGLAVNAGVINLTGGTFDNGGQLLNNTGEISGYGVLRTGGMANNGTITLSGTNGFTTTVIGAVNNSIGKSINVQFQPAIFTGNIINLGTITVTQTTVTFAGSYSGNQYISDPSDNIFQNNVTIFAGGTMSGGTGDKFYFSGGNFNNSGIFTNAGLINSADNVINTGSFNQSGAQTWAVGTVFTNTGAALFGSDAGAGGANLKVLANAGTVTFGSTQHLAGLNVASGALVTVTGGGTGKRSVVFTPSFFDSGSIDLTGNDLDLQTGGTLGLTNVTALVAKGYNGGSWTGPGITSSSAANDLAHLTAVGVILNNVAGSAIYTTFDGTLVARNDVLVKETYYGDANLDGKVDGTDYSLTDNGFLQHLTGWRNGDFNYDGTVNGSDYTLIDNAFNRQGVQLDSVSATPTAIVFGGISAVPEPAPGLIGLAAICLLGRRNRWRDSPAI